jgi:hypothetical protein
MPVIATTISTSTAQGRYAVQSDVESQFGVDNVAAWSQLNSSITTADIGRIQTSLDYADARIINAFLNFGNYATPLAPLGTDVALVTRWAAVIAGAWLYQSRGLRTDNAVNTYVSQLLAAVEAAMQNYRAGEKLNAARRWPTTTAPVGY